MVVACFTAHLFHSDLGNSTRQIKHGGLCLDHNLQNGNVFMYPCHGDNNQQWQYDSENRLKTPHDSSKCLDWDTVNNLFMYPCHGNDNQKFVLPSHWLPSIEGLESSSTEAELPQTYQVRPVQRGVWEKSNENVCTVNMLRDVVGTCDESFSVLLGNATSVGTLRDIAHLVMEEGPKHMPGSCCLDSATSSEWFGANVGTRKEDSVGDAASCAYA